MKNIKIFLFLAVAISMCVFISCAPKIDTTQGEVPIGIESAVKKLWDAKVKNDWGTVYDMTVEAYRQSMEREKFIARANVQYEDVSRLEIQPTGDKNRMVVDVKCVTVIMGHRLDYEGSEEWVLENGQWRLKMLPSLDSDPFNSK